MSRVPYSLTAIRSDDDSSGKNIVPYASVSVVDANGNPAQIYLQETGGIPSSYFALNENGFKQIWAEPGRYTITIDGGETYDIFLTGDLSDRVQSVATIAELALTPAAIDQVIFLKGGGSPGDSGSGAFIAKAGSVTPNGKTVVGSATAGIYWQMIDTAQYLRLVRPYIKVGENPISGAALRDAVVVARDVTGLTDCHAFADRTIIDGVTDYGGYGVFDATTVLRGIHTHNHVFSFQDRVKYEGGGTLEFQTGLYSRPVHSGAGTIETRYGVDVGDISIIGEGDVETQIGVYIRNLKGAGTNVGLNIAQTAGVDDYAIYCGGGARSYLAGALEVGGGVSTSTGLAVRMPTGPEVLRMKGSPVGSAELIADTGASFAYIGTPMDVPFRLIQNASARLEVSPSTSQYAIRPGADNTQPLGDALRRWSQVYAGTATISTSDAREKTAVRELTEAELAVGRQLAREIGAYKWLEAIDRKGDGARWHTGQTVQRAIQIFEQHGLDPFAYGAICYDEWGQEAVEHPAEYETVTIEAELDENGFEVEPRRDEKGGLIKAAWTEIVQHAGNSYGWRDNELMWLMIAATAKWQDDLCSRIRALESNLS